MQGYSNINFQVYNLDRDFKLNLKEVSGIVVSLRRLRLTATVTDGDSDIRVFVLTAAMIPGPRPPGLGYPSDSDILKSAGDISKLPFA